MKCLKGGRVRNVDHTSYGQIQVLPELEPALSAATTQPHQGLTLIQKKATYAHGKEYAQGKKTVA